jgi:thiamine-monophosphate kinase
VIDKSVSPLFSPVSQINAVFALHEAGLLKCAMDTSDGLAPTLEELATVNGVTIDIDVSTLRFESENFADVAARPERFWFGWGDWTVVTAVSKTMLPDLSRMMGNLSMPWSDVGRVLMGPPGVYLADGTRKIRARRLESERFAPDSWFIQGIDEYTRRLQAFPLP